MPETILVVDDQASIRQLLKDYLTEQGYRVLTAEDGLSALTTARRDQPDLILLDVRMPVMDGYQFLREYRRQERHIPVIMLSAHEEEADMILGLTLGADDYLTKPFRMRELLARIRALIRRAERHTQKHAESAD